MNNIERPRLTTPLLFDLWEKWSKNPEHQRFGQYIWNNTRFSLNEVDGVLIYQDKNGEKVLEVLRKYLDSIHA